MGLVTGQGLFVLDPLFKRSSKLSKYLRAISYELGSLELSLTRWKLFSSLQDLPSVLMGAVCSLWWREEGSSISEANSL